MARTDLLRYPLELAMSDVVQRCLEAGAGQVDVAVEFAGADSWIRIAADAASIAEPGDSCGPAPASPPRTPEGFSIVDACLTQGTEVSVAAEAGGHTVVVVENLHGVLAYKRQEGRVIEAVLARMRSRLDEALGLAFHRVLAGVQRRRPPVSITVNAEPVAPRDPFAAETESTPRRRELPFVVDGSVHNVLAAPHLLPAGGDDAGRGRQGFFVYLRDRLVQPGGWSRLSIGDSGDGVVRVAVDLPSAAVASFGWEAAQRRVLFPATLAPALRAVAVEASSARLPALAR